MIQRPRTMITPTSLAALRWRKVLGQVRRSRGKGYTVEGVVRGYLRQFEGTEGEGEARRLVGEWWGEVVRARRGWST